jgi:DNA-binding CsgD family transcriptional regulator
MIALSVLSLKKPLSEVQSGDHYPARRAPAKLGEDVFALVCPDRETPTLILDAGGGHVAYANWNCLQLLERQAPVGLSDERLIFHSADVNRRFYRALEHTAAGGSPERAVVAGHCDRSLTWFSVVIRNMHGFFRDALHRSLMGGDPLSRFVLIEFRLSRNSPDPTALLALAEACALSPAETDVVKLLACGWSLPQIASSRGVKLATIRQCMKNLLAKTNCHRQTELIHLVMSLCPMVRER